MRRLDRGTFAFPRAATAEVSVTATELAMILGGVELAATRRRPRYAIPGNPPPTRNPPAVPPVQGA